VSADAGEVQTGCLLTVQEETDEDEYGLSEEEIREGVYVGLQV